MLNTLDGQQTKELFKYARSKGVMTSLDPVCRPGSSEIIGVCLPYLDYFLPNNDESVHITGLTEPMDQLRFYLDSGVKIAGIKLGEGGCLISDGSLTYKLGIYDVPVADTCGAGDAFVAGFLYGAIKNFDICKSAVYASAVAAFCVQGIGTTSAVPKIDKVETFIYQNAISIEEVSL